MTKEQKALHWIRQIDRTLQTDKRFKLNRWQSGKNNLLGIRQRIIDAGEVTKNQIQAIKNIKYGKN